MKLAFSLFNYFPYGGLQRDFLSIVIACLHRGHEVDAFVMSWEGDIPAGLNVIHLKTVGMSNHQRSVNFSKQLKKKLKQKKYDCIVGFNKVPGLDIYFSGDDCYQSKARQAHGLFYRFTSRYRHYVFLEKSVFDKKNKTQILILNEKEKIKFHRCYGTAYSRFHLLPPGIDENRIATPDANLVSNELRDEFSIQKNELLLLMVASDFKTKGLERCIETLASLPATKLEKVHFFVIGKGEKEPYQWLAKKLKVDHRLFFLGAREDVERFYMAADVLLHPAYTENAGKVLLEAMACGLPIIATEVCGYAYHIQRANAGVLMPSPFSQKEFNKHCLMAIEEEEKRKHWKTNALSYISSIDIFSMASTAVDKIEQWQHVSSS